MKKLLAFVLAAIMFCLCGCGDSDIAAPSSPANEIIDLTPSNTQSGSDTTSLPEEPQEPQTVDLYLVTEFKYTNWEYAGEFKYSYKYDDAGNRTSGSYEDDYGYGKISYSYNEMGMLTKEVKKVYMDNGESTILYSTTTTKHAYDDVGNVVKTTLKEVDMWDNERSTTYRYKYDDAGNLIERTEYEGDDNDLARHVYQYDENGKLAKKTVYLFGDLEYIYKYEYDQDDRLSVKKGYIKGDSYAEATTYTYDILGNLINASTTGPSGKETSTSKYSYTAVRVSPEIAERFKKMYNFIDLLQVGEYI